MFLKNKKILKLGLNVIVFILLILPFLVSADAIAVPNPLKVDTVEKLIDLVISKVLMPIGAVVAVVMIMYAGFLYVTARGNKDKIKTAHSAITWAVLGACLLLGSMILSKAIQSTITKFQ